MLRSMSASASVRIIVPHRGLDRAKTRLASVLDPAEREALAGKLLARVLAVARQACDDVVVISPSAPLQPIVEESGARLAVQHGMGLNRGLDEARAEAVGDGIEILVTLHGDLPNLRVEEITELVGALAPNGGVAIAPDRAGTGTNGLALRPPAVIGFRFGIDSFEAHRAEAERAGVPFLVVDRPGLSFDLDTPDDLARWLELGDAA
jgi:2-phospho-L-lactate/phosphoenolpyruvate guanylyltransferase